MGALIDVRARVGTFRLDVRIEVPRGPLALVGPNGAGKSTLLRVLAGAIAPEDGRIAIDGRVLADTASGALLPPEERSVGYLPQGYALFEHLTAAENVAWGLRHLRRADRARAARDLLAELEVAELADRRPAALSGGQRQRVALARALATRPRLLLLDEPTSALDVTVRPAARALLARHLGEPGRASVVVTHDLRDLLAWQPTVALLDDGRVAARGSLAALRDHPHPFLRELLALLP